VAEVSTFPALGMIIRPRRSHAHRDADVRGGVDQAVEGALPELGAELGEGELG
jgi:hypothetical protein